MTLSVFHYKHGLPTKIDRRPCRDPGTCLRQTNRVLPRFRRGPQQGLRQGYSDSQDHHKRPPNEHMNFMLRMKDSLIEQGAAVQQDTRTGKLVLGFRSADTWFNSTAVNRDYDEGLAHLTQFLKERFQKSKMEVVNKYDINDVLAGFKEGVSPFLRQEKGALKAEVAEEGRITFLYFPDLMAGPLIPFDTIQTTEDLVKRGDLQKRDGSDVGAKIGYGFAGVAVSLALGILGALFG